MIAPWPDSSIRRRLAQFTYTIISRAEARSQLWCITSIKLLLCALSSNLKQKLFYNHTFLSCLNLLLCSCITYSRQDFQEWNVGAIETSNCSYMLSCWVPFAYSSEKCLDNRTIKLTPNEIHASAIMEKNWCDSIKNQIKTPETAAKIKQCCYLAMLNDISCPF